MGDMQYIQIQIFASISISLATINLVIFYYQDKYSRDWRWKIKTISLEKNLLYSP